MRHKCAISLNFTDGILFWNAYKEEKIVATPRVWELVRCFKNECKSLGWKTSENEDWIYADQKYHNFLWTRSIPPTAFSKLAKSCRCAVREGVSYRVVDTAYTAWLFSDSPPEQIIRAVIEDPDLSRTTAVYHIDATDPDKPTCLRLNLTKSKVFREFENFLKKRWNIEFHSSEGMLTAEA